MDRKQVTPGVFVANSDSTRLWPTGLCWPIHEKEFSSDDSKAIMGMADVVGCRVGCGYNLKLKETGEEFRVEDSELGKTYGVCMDMAMLIRGRFNREGMIIIVS